jgi:hypothetical protein
LPLRVGNLTVCGVLKETRLDADGCAEAFGTRSSRVRGGVLATRLRDLQCELELGFTPSLLGSTQSLNRLVKPGARSLASESSGSSGASIAAVAAVGNGGDGGGPATSGKDEEAWAPPRGGDCAGVAPGEGEAWALASSPALETKPLRRTAVISGLRLRCSFCSSASFCLAIVCIWFSSWSINSTSGEHGGKDLYPSSAMSGDPDSWQGPCIWLCPLSWRSPPAVPQEPASIP